MSIYDFNSYSPRLASATYKSLLNCVPPTEKSSYLQDVVDVLMHSLSNGQLFFDLTTDSPRIELRNAGWPNAHLNALASSGWVNGSLSPIVLHKSRLSWRRWHRELQLVVDDLIQRSSTSENFLTESLPVECDLPSDLNQEQLRAVLAIDKHNLLLISGGPGTGKTTTIVQLISRALAKNPDLRVAVSAPTGKAARRLQESIQKNINKLDSLQKKKLDQLACLTLHRLLEANKAGFRRNRENQLTLDLLVVDEMSMVDLKLMRGLLEALSPNCQLVLVGDPDQLPPVGSGSIWQILWSENSADFAENSVSLCHVYRNKGALDFISRVLRDQGISSFEKKIKDLPVGANFSLHHSSIRKIPSTIRSQVDAFSQRLSELSISFVAQQSTENSRSIVRCAQSLFISDHMFSLLEAFLVLCPRRRGLWGVDHFHQELLGKKFELGVMAWPQGFPVMCGENQSELGLANGDIGLVIGEGKRRRILFRISGEEGLLTCLINPSRIRCLEPAMALTIHKSQGSEAKDVFVLWPEPLQNYKANSNQLLEFIDSYETRLLYTAITRACDHLYLFTPIK